MMPHDPSLFDSFPDEENRKPQDNPDQENKLPQLQPQNWNLETLWDGLTQLGLAEPAQRYGTHLILFLLVLLVIWAVPQLTSYYPLEELNTNLAVAAPAVTPTAQPSGEPTPTANISEQNPLIIRQAQIHTSLPSRSRYDVTKYKVTTGDTLFGIAEKFGLKPETLLWGNQFVLGDNPHNLRPDQELNILPVDGTYYKWQAGDGLNGVAKFFGVDPQVIVEWPGNHLDPNTIGDYAHPNIEAGTWLVIPGGKRAFVTWSAPEIPRDNPGVAKVLGPGACGSVADGAIGVGLFIWPTNAHFLSGFDYTPEANHFGIDIDGDTGNAVYAVDNGVVVYAGWNNWGYGNVIVVNHGNGWQTLYAHLSALSVSCGQSVYQGNIIGSIGTTGNSSGPHLHFEMMYNGTKVNPWNYLPSP